MPAPSPILVSPQRPYLNVTHEPLVSFLALSGLEVSACLHQKRPEQEAVQNDSLPLDMHWQQLYHHSPTLVLPASFLQRPKLPLALLKAPRRPRESLLMALCPTLERPARLSKNLAHELLARQAQSAPKDQQQQRDHQASSVGRPTSPASFAPIQRPDLPAPAIPFLQCPPNQTPDKPQPDATCSRPHQQALRVSSIRRQTLLPQSAPALGRTSLAFPERLVAHPA